MRISRSLKRLVVGSVWLVLAMAVMPAAVSAQPESGKVNLNNVLDAPLDLSGFSKPKKTASGAKITLEPADAKAGDTVTLKIVITTASDAYTYSMDESFAGRTRIEVKSAAGLTEIDKTFSSDRKPKAEQDPLLNQRVEKFPGGVTWTRRFKVEDPANVSLTGSIRFQICDASSCRPFNEKFDLKLSAEKKEPVFSQRFAPTTKVKGDVVPGPSEWTLTLSPANAKPGDKVTVKISAKLKDGFHTFAIDQDKKNYGLPTVIDVRSMSGLKALGKGFVPDREVELHTELGKVQRIHHGEVSWSRDFEVLEDAATDGYGLAGELSFQTCSQGPNGRCIASDFDFELGRVTKKATETASAVGVIPSKPSSGGDGNSRFDSIQYREPGAEEADSSLSMYLLYAFLGGLILNVMPCVLPVIAIKVLSFVQQAGESRSRILALNASYSVGVLAVFMVLATLAAFAGMAWGGLFQHAGFIIAMAALVFVMALSLLGVFELPVPGMVGSVGAAQREGLSGAFLTGIFATLLATPCSGPFLGTTLGWSVQQEPHVIYAVWAVMAFGMASPYLLFGLFPGAVKLLPKPGNWMVRFKEFAGFVLLGTTIYLISILGEEYVLPTLILLLGLGTWMVGNLYNLASPAALRWKVRILALILTGGIAGFGYQIHEGGDELPWEPFSTEALASALDEGRPVLVDFTADWCPNCKLVERISLNRKGTRDFVSTHNVKTLKADYTNFSDEITAWLDRFDSTSIPVTAVFSPGRPTEPLLIRDVYTQGTLLEVLETAASETQSEVRTASVDRVVR